MLRRSKRLIQNNMSSKENSRTPSPASDMDKTIIKANEPTVAELSEEIELLKNSLQKLLDASKSPKPADATTVYSLNTAITPPAAADEPTSTTQMQQQTANTLEYPFLYNLPQPFTASLSNASTSSYTAPQPCISTPMPFYTRPYHMPHTVAQSCMTTTTTTPLSTSMDYFSTHMYATSQPRKTPTTPINLPSYVTTASLNRPNAQSFYENSQLRKLHDLPYFSGQPEQWPMFTVAFRETTENYRYTKLENLIRLQKSLRGEARTKVESLLIRPDSVEQAISTLEFHFGRPQLLIRSQLSKVRSFPPISEQSHSVR